MHMCARQEMYPKRLSCPYFLLDFGWLLLLHKLLACCLSLYKTVQLARHTQQDCDPACEHSEEAV